MRNVSAFQPRGTTKAYYPLNGNLAGLYELANTSLLSDANLNAYWKLEDANDSTANARNLTNNGTVTFGSAKFNNGADLGASNSTKYLSRADCAGLTNTSNFTLSFWIKLNTEITTGQYSLFSCNFATNRYAVIEYQYNAGTRRLIFEWSAGSFASYNIALGTDSWTHISVTKSSTALVIYVNGVQVATGTAGASGGNGSNTLTIGRESSVSASFASCLFDDYSIFSRALSADEIKLIYGLRALDYSGNANHGTETAITYPQGRFGQAAKFNGTTSQISLGNSGVNFGTGDFTVSCWYYLKPGFTDGEYVIMRASGVSPFVQYLIYSSTSNGGFVFQMNNTAAGVNNSINTCGAIPGRWYLLTATMSGTTMTLYVNGNPKTSQTTFSGTRCNLNINTTIGLRDGGGATPASGIVDEVILESRAWTAKEVETYYRKSMLNYKIKWYAGIADLVSRFFLFFR